MTDRSAIRFAPFPDPPAPARSAATVELIRESAGGIETYLMRRRKSKGAFGGAFVFPGGVVEPSDSAPEIRLRAVPPVMNGTEIPWPLFVAAIRETYEESGVLLADGAENLPRGLRSRVADGSLPLAELAGTFGLTFRADRLLPAGRWITPLSEGRRFDAWFFLARMPGGQEARPDGDELVEGLWMDPRKALSEHGAGRLPLLPPTVFSLWQIARHGSWNALAESVRRREIAPMLPQPFYTDRELGVLLPGDPDYGIEAFRRAPRPGEPSRVVARDGRWELMGFRGEG